MLNVFEKSAIHRSLAIMVSTLAVLAFGLVVGCSGDGQGTSGGSDNVEFITLGSAPVGGVFNQVGAAIASVVNEYKGDTDWKVQAKGTKGSKQNIRMLDKGEIQLGMSNSAISFHAVRGLSGWDKEYKIRTVVTLAPNIGLFITKKDSGINTIADLKGKRVSVGPAGAGFEMFLGPLLAAHGINYSGSADGADFSPQNEDYSAAVQSLADGNADAAFMGGATPTPAVVQACNTNDIQFVSYDPNVLTNLIKDYPFFSPAKIPATTKDGKPTYKGMESDFEAMNVGSMQLITHADVDEELIYNLTKTIWENRDEIVKQHPAAKAINEQNAARNTGTEFHPGAIRFYKEIGIWPEEG
jgi:TRAP transporter TAXI family solute receptor